MSKLKRAKSLAVSAAAAIVAATPAFASQADAKTPDFFFAYDEEDLQSTSGARRVYKRLEREAAESCAPVSSPDEQDVCQKEIVARVVYGVDDKKLVAQHADATKGVERERRTKPHFFFNYDDDSLDSVNGTRRMYDRLRSEASAFCENTANVDVEICKSELVDRVVAGIDENKLDLRHRRERGTSVYIVDQ